MKFLAAFCIVLFLSMSCQSIEEVEKPTPFIPEATMKDMLYEVAVMNAARGYNVQKLKKNNVSPDTYVFEKYGYDSLQYAQNTVYYASNADQYKAMYESVEQRINHLHDSINTIVQEEKRVKDSISKIKNLERRLKDSLKRAQKDTLIKPASELQRFNTLRVKEMILDSI